MGESADILAQGSERDPWRPSRRFVLLGLVCAMLLGAGVYAIDTAQDNRAERSARRLAVEQIALLASMDPDPEVSPLDWRLGVLNTSDVEVRVRRAALDFPSLSLVTEQRLRPFHRLGLNLPATGVCDPGLYRRGPQSVLVEGTTLDGLSVNRRLVLSRDHRDELWLSLRLSCRFLQPYDSMEGELTGARLTGRTLTLSYELKNFGAVPLVIDRISYLPGIDVESAGLPMTLPPGISGADSTARRLVVQLRITSCERLAAGVITKSGEGLTQPATALAVDVHHQYGRGPESLGFSGGFGQAGPVPANIDQGLRLLRTCPHVAELIEKYATGH